MARRLKRLTDQHRKAASMLLTQKPAAVAAKLGVSRKTLLVWKRDPTFAALLRSLADERDKSTLDAIAALSDKVAAVLGDLIGSKNESIRLAAVKELRQWFTMQFDYRRGQEAQEVIRNVTAVLDRDDVTDEEAEEVLREILGQRRAA